jgi:glucosamine--fructose-6-phosphate aminotransferase (isomerizing)
MCGIVGYIGGDQAVPVLLNGLSKLEYRGYDSAGISVYEDGIRTIKVKGRLAGLAEKLEKTVRNLLTSALATLVGQHTVNPAKQTAILITE